MDESISPSYDPNPHYEAQHQGEPDWCWAMRRELLNMLETADESLISDLDCLRTENESLRAGIEQEAAYCAMWAVDIPVHLRGIGARLRALLE